MLDMCLGFGYGGVGGVSGEWIGGLDRGSGAVGWCYACVGCEYGLSV